MNKVEISRKDNITEIKINGQVINFVGQYSISQNINERDGLPMLEIKMAIDEKIQK